MLGLGLVAIGMVLLIAIGKHAWQESDYENMDTPFDAFFIAYGARYRVSPRLLKAIALWEHRGAINPQAIANEPGGHHSYGVMQIHDSNLPWLARTIGLNKDDLLKAEQNIEAGAALMRQMISELGPKAATDEAIIQSWNEGTPAYKAGKRVPTYLAGVLGFYEQLGTDA